MKNAKAIGFLIAFVMILSSFAFASIDESAKIAAQEAYGELPLYFIKNDGQLNKSVKFYEKGKGHSTFFTKDGVYLSLSSDAKTQNELVKLIPLGANKNPGIAAEGLLEGKVNYFTGNDSGKWKTNLPTYKTIAYKELYKGIDMKFYGNNRQLEYDIIVKPGADPSKVRLSYEGIKSLKVTDQGELLIGLQEGSIIQRKPVIYQEIDGKRVDVAGQFKILNRHSKKESSQFAYGFDIGVYDKNHPIIIDPVLVYSTYLGGDNWDAGYGIAVDATGNVYVAGVAYSNNFPVVLPIYGSNAGGYDTFITKINASGTGIVYSTYLGGSNQDFGSGIAVDGSGCAYVTGYTYSGDFPTISPLQGFFGGNTDAFIAKINEAGNALLYSTYLGGSGWDVGQSIAVNTLGDAYITGPTDSIDFPVASAIQSMYAGGGNDAFVAKIDVGGNSLSYSTYLGGNGWDEGHDIGVDVDGNAYITGFTGSSNFPLVSPLQGIIGGSYDAFVTKMNSSGNNILYSTYLGGSAGDYGTSLALDGVGNAYVTGYTFSSNFPIVSALYGTINGNSDAFVSKINSMGNSLVYSTYLGGSSDDQGYAIAVDNSGNAYITGYTASTNFPIAFPIFRNNAGGDDVFVTKINSSGSNLAYSSYLGGTALDHGHSITVDTSGNAYITGQTHSDNFPTASAIFGSTGGWVDGFVTKIGPSKK